MTKPEQPSDAAMACATQIADECLHTHGLTMYVTYAALDTSAAAILIDAALREAYQRGYRQSEVDDNWDGVGDDGYVEGGGDE